MGDFDADGGGSYRSTISPFSFSIVAKAGLNLVCRLRDLFLSQRWAFFGGLAQFVECRRQALDGANVRRGRKMGISAAWHEILALATAECNGSMASIKGRPKLTLDTQLINPPSPVIGDYASIPLESSNPKICPPCSGPILRSPQHHIRCTPSLANS